MRWIIVALLILLVGLQYRLWFSEGSLSHRAALQEKIEQQKAENNRLRERNTVLALEVEALKSGLDVIEERAREQMGMIRDGETFFMIVEPKKRRSTQ
ncbi:MAG: cell division protein FtsB [Granulosicoccus sp.]|jgi:cell division protein FtsB